MPPQEIPEERNRLNDLRLKVIARAGLAANDKIMRLFQNLLADIDCRLAVLDQFEAAPPADRATSITSASTRSASAGRPMTR